MDTCKTCKHWTADENPIVNPTEMVKPWESRKIPMAFEVRRCMSPLLKQDVRPAESHHASPHGDGSGVYAAPLYTGPDFGCINHEAMK